eukprot:gene3502-4618_t
MPRIGRRLRNYRNKPYRRWWTDGRSLHHADLSDRKGHVIVSYKSSPRPVFDRAVPIPYRDVTRHVWGEPAAGEVADWIYVSSGEIHQLLFGLPPGAGFRHSESYRTVFGADEVLYVLAGTMVIANPETGDVRKVETGEAIFFRKDTWHHAWAYGTDELRVLEYFAPPPSTGSSGAYARTRPYIKVQDAQYRQPGMIGRWPMAAGEGARPRDRRNQANRGRIAPGR